MGVTCDVTDRVEVFRSVAHIRETLGEIDILVSCVGVYPVQPTLMWTPEELYTLFDTNVMSQFWVSYPLFTSPVLEINGDEPVERYGTLTARP